MKDMMMRIAKIRELVKQRDIDEIASLVDKYVLNTVFDGRSLTDTASYNLNVPLTKKLFEMGAFNRAAFVPRRHAALPSFFNSIQPLCVLSCGQKRQA